MGRLIHTLDFPKRHAEKNVAVVRRQPLPLLVRHKETETQEGQIAVDLSQLPAPAALISPVPECVLDFVEDHTGPTRQLALRLG